MSNKCAQKDVWAFVLPVWAFVHVGFCPRGICPTLLLANSISSHFRRLLYEAGCIEQPLAAGFRDAWQANIGSVCIVHCRYQAPYVGSLCVYTIFCITRSGGSRQLTCSFRGGCLITGGSLSLPCLVPSFAGSEVHE